MFKLPENTSSFTAETFAIYRALNFAQNIEFTNIAIITDSLSILQKLLHPSWSPKTNYLLLKILEEYHKLASRNKKVTFIWVKAHESNVGNNTADLLAKRATTEGEPVNLLLSPYDAFALFKATIIAEWQKLWNESSTSRGHSYSLKQPTVNKKPWFYKSNLKKKVVSTVCRLRFNHGSFPSHLHKIRIVDNPECDCDNVSVGDVNHFIFSCSKYEQSRREFFEQLADNGVTFPVSEHEILSLTKKFYDPVIGFIINTNANF